LKPNETELEFLKLSYNRFYDLYDEIMEDKMSTVQRVIDFLGISKTKQEIEAAINRAMNHDVAVIRRNKIVTGRGLKILTEQQIQQINHYASYYPDIDFSPLGIPSINPNNQFENIKHG